MLVNINSGHLKCKVMLEKELPTCSVFDNLTTLEIGGWCLTDDFKVVLRFLQLSPRLEELILKHRKVRQIQNRCLLLSTKMSLK